MLSFGCFCSIINNCIGASQHHGEKIIKDGDQAQWCYSLMPAVKITEKKYIHNMNAEQCEVILRFLNETNKGKKIQLCSKKDIITVIRYLFVIVIHL